MHSAEQPHQSFDHYRRTYNDTATWLAETLDGSMMTPFEYTYHNGELYAEDGSAIGAIFHDAERDATRIAAEQPALSFELRRRRLELGEYADMLKMVRGELPNTMVVVSDFPPELMEAATSVGGYNVARKQTMLRVLTWDGAKLTMRSQSLDASDRTALEAIYRQYGITPEAGELLGQRIYTHTDTAEQPYVTSQLTGVYDREMTAHYGGNWYAGRKDTRRDTYQFVLSQHALLDHFATRFMHSQPSDEDRYNIAALMRERFESFSSGTIHVHEADVVFAQIHPHALEQQLLRAGNTARAEGRSFDGCGISVSASKSAEDQFRDAGYGSKSGLEDKFGSLSFTCTKGHRNTRPYGKLISNCRQCGEDVSCKEPEKQKQNVKAKTLSLRTFFGVAPPETLKKPALKQENAAFVLAA